MDWRDEGTLLNVRHHGENAAIIEVFTAAHGRHAGVVRGGASRRMRPILQPGAQLDLSWRARLEDHLGSYTVEPIRSRAGPVMADPMALAGMNAALGLLSWALPEREPHPELYERTQLLLDMIGISEAWPLAYLRWELALLDEMGFGLDLGRCAVSGRSDDLAYVSPRSGKAVSRAGAGEWADRLLPLPPALLGHGNGPLEEIVLGLSTTGFFLQERMAAQFVNRPVPAARERLLGAFRRRARAAG